ncbi:PadR family transcriptional regulator [Pseudokineococcus basanitobsidens]|uniref:PadR family transcriptional regulator n=1 Tax=Pseudokineococcus basanitobsidens TaxID=1926649 RepID=A0ABU8RNN9_9ACTN
MPKDMTEPAFWVLTALAETPRHGYAVLGRVEELTGGQSPLRVTTLYATLERLERDGRVRVVSEEVVAGRARRTYDITTDGREALSLEADRLVARASAAQASLDRGRPAPTRTTGWATA